MYISDLPLVFLDYGDVIVKHFKAILKKPPEFWKKGTKGDIILIQGWGEVWTFQEKIAHYLNKQGYSIHVLSALERNTYPMDYCLNCLEEYIAANKLNNLILVGHSKGAKIAKYFLNESKFSSRITKVVCIAGAWQGTKLAKLKFWNLQDVAPKSSFLLKLAANSKHHHKILNLYPRIDTMIFPHESLILPGAKNLQINSVGHARVLDDKTTLTEIHNFVQQ